jgi:hypothetical protein
VRLDVVLGVVLVAFADVPVRPGSTSSGSIWRENLAAVKAALQRAFQRDQLPLPR